MSFSVRLVEPRTKGGPPVLLSAGRDSSLREVLLLGCEVLQVAGYKFVVSGFGEATWATDVAYDLELILEQLEDTIHGLKEVRTSQLDFAGQGIQRVVDLTPVGPGLVELRCRSGARWAPNPSFELHSQAEVGQMLVALAVDFAAATRRVLPELVLWP